MGSNRFFVIIINIWVSVRRSLIWPPFSIKRNMKISVNKKDIERVIAALTIAESSVKGTRSEELFRLTRKKIKRQSK